MSKRNFLKPGFQFALFTTSYFPLFFLIILKQLFANSEKLKFGGFNYEAIILFIKHFGLSSILSIISIVGFIGLYFGLQNLNDRAENGFNVSIEDVKNKNSESISYIGTYIIPFLFQNYDGWYDLIAIMFLLFVIYKIYVNSSLLLINPLLNTKYFIFDVDFKDQEGKLKNCMILTKLKALEEEEKIKIYKIGHKLFYGIKSP
jgi:hypothetical protein